MKETERTRSNISRIDRRSRPPREYMPGESAAERAVRLRMEAEEAKHRRRREESDAAQRHWRERLITKSAVFLVLCLVAACAAVMLLGDRTTPEAKEWASTTLKYGTTALVAYLTGASHKIGS